MKRRRFALMLLMLGGAAMASDEHGIDETIKPKLIAGSCALAQRALEPWDETRPGIVELELQISADGKVERVKLVTGSGDAAADETVQQEVRDCRYAPATQNRVPVSFVLLAKFRANAK